MAGFWPGYSLRSFLVICLASGAAGALLRYACGSWGRRYAAAGMGIVFFLGLNWRYNLPSYSYLLALLVVPLLFRGTVEERLKRAVRRIPLLELTPPRTTLELAGDAGGGHLGTWKARSPDTEPLTLWLDFVGLMEDEYEVVLSAEAPRLMRGALLIHHREARGRPAGLWPRMEPVANLPGQEAWMSVRAAPADFAYRLLDAKTVALVGDLFDLQNEAREMYVQVEGRNIRVASSKTFGPDELKNFLSAGAACIQKIRQASLSLNPPA